MGNENGVFTRLGIKAARMGIEKQQQKDSSNKYGNVNQSIWSLIGDFQFPTYLCIFLSLCLRWKPPTRYSLPKCPFSIGLKAQWPKANEWTATAARAAQILPREVEGVETYSLWKALVSGTCALKQCVMLSWITIIFIPSTCIGGFNIWWIYWHIITDITVYYSYSILLNPWWNLPSSSHGFQ